MRCEQVTPYLPGFAGGDLRDDTARTVASHVDGCARCSAEVVRQERVLAGLASMSAREIEPPAFLLDAITEAVHDPKTRRVIPLVPVLPEDLSRVGHEVSRIGQEVGRVVSENREALTQAAGTALVAMAAAYVFKRAMRSRRAGPATS